MVNTAATSPIQHIFVLMLENRSFDHMLGFSGLAGTDAQSQQSTWIDGLTGTESNSLNGVTYVVTRGADLVMPVDPSHEFEAVVQQLCGAGTSYPAGGAYPPVNNSGFVAEYAASGGQSAPAEILKCYTPDQLPVLNALAREFVVFDHWFSSLPGPTWPNRFFAHAASSGGLDHSPSSANIATWMSVSGFQFEQGTIFDALNRLNSTNGWRIYSGADFPCVAGLKGISTLDIHDFSDFDGDVNGSNYPYLYTFIEPNYGDVVSNTYRGGTSQHPLDDVTHGEGLIKSVYESIRKSPLWPNSLLIVTWDEHGGFYDHVYPPPAVAPGDTIMTSGASQFNFTFEQYGVRVPALAISPLIPKNLIDHRHYDHASIPATIERVFGINPLTQRDAQANSLESLATLTSPRTDAPMTLPDPLPPADGITLARTSPSAAGPTDSIDKGNLPGFLHAALCSDLALTRVEQHAAIKTQFNAIKTRTEAQDYLNHVRVKVGAGRAATRGVLHSTVTLSPEKGKKAFAAPERKLGKHPPRHDIRTLTLEQYVSADRLPQPPAKVDWAVKVPVWPMMKNDTLNDCTCAAAGHLIECWNTATTGTIVPSDDQIVAAYSLITGYNPTTGANDNGASTLDVLNFWRQNGIAGHKIGAYVVLEPQNQRHIKDAIFLFGGCYIGLALPVSAQNQQVWSVPPGGPTASGAPGSWGCHAVPIVAYDSRGLTCVTWGELKRMTWTFWEAYCDEAYAIISLEWLNDHGKAPSGLDLAQLSEDLKLLGRSQATASS